MSDDLKDHLNRYFRCNLKIRSEQTRAIYRYTLANLHDSLGHNPTLDDLTDDNCAAMMNYLLQAGKAERTVNERRARLHAFWSWLAKRSIVKTFPTTPRLEVPIRTPIAWTKAELIELLKACGAQEGTIGTIPAKHWWASLHLVMWDTSERISALIATRWEHLQGEWLHLPAEVRKGKRSDACYKLRPETLRLLEKIRSDRPYIWPWPYVPMYLWVKYRILRKQAGLPSDRLSSFHRMRKSVASHLEAAGGNATEALGHASRSVTVRSYLDPRITEKPQPMDKLFRIEEDGGPNLA